ncbi:helix-turn-helix domain-containing protein [Paenibacillus sp. CAU 1782]
MCLTSHEACLMQELHHYSGIPLSLFNGRFERKLRIWTEAPASLPERWNALLADAVASMAHSGFELVGSGDALCFVIVFERRRMPFYAVGGPVQLANRLPAAGESGSLSYEHAFRQPLGQEGHRFDHPTPRPPVVSWSSLRSCARILLLLLNKNSHWLEELQQTFDYFERRESFLGDGMERPFTNALFEKREAALVHTPYSHEVAVLNCVREGNVPQLESTYKAFPPTQYGSMSNHPLRQFLYGCIANTTLVTRYAIEGGLDEETAFTLSDAYIKQMEKCGSQQELGRLNEKMAVDFTEHVSRIKAGRKAPYSGSVLSCLDYIAANLHGKITLEALSAQTRLTPKYLSALFRKETGQTVTSYIEEKRIEEAKRLLLYSRYASSRISHDLSFHSHSYFISVFKKRTGMTPKKYRERWGR